MVKLNGDAMNRACSRSAKRKLIFICTRSIAALNLGLILTVESAAALLSFTYAKVQKYLKAPNIFAIIFKNISQFLNTTEETCLTAGFTPTNYKISVS